MVTENGLEYEVVEYTLQNVINNLSTIFKGWTKEDGLRASKQQNQYAMVFVGKDGKPFSKDEHIYDAWRDFQIAWAYASLMISNRTEWKMVAKNWSMAWDICSANSKNRMTGM